MRPGPVDWATNANWAGGPDVGTRTKEPPAAGKVAEGHYGAQRPSAREWNWMRWALGSRLNGAVSQRLLNITERFDLSALGGFVGNRCDGCWDPLLVTASILEERIAVAAADFVCIGGLQPYALGAGFFAAPAAAATAMRVAIDPTTGNRAAVLGAGGPGEFPWHSAAYANFVQWPGMSVNRAWTDVDYTTIGSRWLFGDNNGLIHRATGVGITSAPAGVPGWGAVARMIIGASNHAAGDVYPDDPGNDSIIALTDIECSYATDAIANNWAVAAAHGLANTPWDCAYSKAGAKWLAVLANGDIAESLDNGATWAVIASLPIRPIGALSTLRIATDGFGDWMTLSLDAGDPDCQVCASWDDGATWTAVHLPSWTGAAPSAGALFYGGGQFHVVTMDNTPGPSYVYTTLRAEE